MLVIEAVVAVVNETALPAAMFDSIYCPMSPATAFAVPVVSPRYQ